MYMIEQPNNHWCWPKPREPRLTKNDYRPYRDNSSHCWKDQSKRKRQYKPVDMAA